MSRRIPNFADRLQKALPVRLPLGFSAWVERGRDTTDSLWVQYAPGDHRFYTVRIIVDSDNYAPLNDPLPLFVEARKKYDAESRDQRYTATARAVSAEAAQSLTSWLELRGMEQTR